MAQFDVQADIQSVTNGNFLVIAPATSAEEWVIHNIYHENDVELYKSDGTNDVQVDAQTGNGAWIGYVFHLTKTQYLKVKNTHTAAALIGYDGIITKSP